MIGSRVFFLPRLVRENWILSSCFPRLRSFLCFLPKVVYFSLSCLHLVHLRPPPTAKVTQLVKTILFISFLEISFQPTAATGEEQEPIGACHLHSGVGHHLPQHGETIRLPQRRRWRRDGPWTDTGRRRRTWSCNGGGDHFPQASTNSDHDDDDGTAAAAAVSGARVRRIAAVPHGRDASRPGLDGEERLDCRAARGPPEERRGRLAQADRQEGRDGWRPAGESGQCE